MSQGFGRIMSSTNFYMTAYENAEKALRMYLASQGISAKQGAVQLYRSLGIRDEQVLEIIQMTGMNAYAN